MNPLRRWGRDVVIRIGRVATNDVINRLSAQDLANRAAIQNLVDRLAARNAEINRASIAVRFLAGRDLEIGALHRPLQLRRAWSPTTSTRKPSRP